MRLNRFIPMAGLFAITTLSACSDSSPFEPNAATLNGTWAEEGEVPGSSEVWNLSVDGAHVTGTGTWSGEACCGGTLTIDGQIRGDSIYLGIKRNGSPFLPPTTVTTIGAVLRSPTEMAASVQPNSGGSEFRMRKQP